MERDTLTRAIKGLRLTSDDIADANWVDNGPGWLAVLLRSRADVLALRSDFSVLSGLRVGVVAPWDPTKNKRDADFEVRAFSAPGFEDPVTGSLNAGITQWLLAVASLLRHTLPARVPSLDGKDVFMWSWSKIGFGSVATSRLCIEGVAAL